jgi:hypothetical protein
MVPNTISVELIDTIDPEYQSGFFSISDLMSQVRALLEGQETKQIS